MSADSFNKSSTRIITILIAGTISNQYQWSEVTDENHVSQCRNEIGPSARLEGKIFFIEIANNYLRVFKYRNYVPIMTRDKSQIKARDGAVLVVPEGEAIYVLEFYEPTDFTSRVRLNPTNSIGDLYDTIVKNVFSVDDFLKNLEEDIDNDNE